MKIKIALRIIPNTIIKLDNVEVEEDQRLQNINGFKDIAKVLYSTRAGVAYMATGALAGALRATLDYVTERKQFGKEISKYQLIQEISYDARKFSTFNVYMCPTC